jgi:CDP-diacylglycerol--serine O-phosphatidyltransferase
MGSYLKAWIEIGWPILSMFFVERFCVSYFLRTEAQCERVRQNWFLHPNSISMYRYPMGFLSVLLYHYGYHFTAVWFFAFWMITDLTDGDIARRCNLSTSRGESLDPLSDKLMYTPPLIYMSWKGLLVPEAVAFFIVFDVIGQFSRLFIKRKAANLFGKAKTFLVVILLTMTSMELIYGRLPHHNLLYPLMIICAGLAFCSTAFKIIPNYWYANILSLMNMACGLAGIWVILAGKPAIYAFGLVFLGQFLDLFDGRAAELWGSTPQGEIFDDVADGTSFGGTVALIVGTAFTDFRLGVGLAVLHFASTIYRLIRFVVEKRKAGVAGGVKCFSGMPSPAGALVAGSACLFLESEAARAVLVLLSSVLMISRVPYQHFGRAMLPRVPKIFRVVFLVAYMLVLSHAIRSYASDLHAFDVPLGAVFVVSLLYMVSPVVWRKDECETGG